LIQLHEELYENGQDMGSQLQAIFEEELNPVAKISQSSVPLPEGLDLDKWINGEENFQHDKDEEFETQVEENPIVTKTTNKKMYILKDKQNDKIEVKDLKEVMGKEKIIKIKLAKSKKEEMKDEKVEILKDEIMPENAVIKNEDKNKNDTNKTKTTQKAKQLGNIELTGLESEEIYKVKEYKKTTKEDLKKEEKKKEKELNLNGEKKPKKKILKKRLCIDDKIKVVSLTLK
jgi:hypothetical protein